MIKIYAWPGLILFCVIWMMTFPVVSLSAEKHIQFATVEWEPYYGSSLLNQGYVSEITREAFKRVGYTIEIKFVPWKRALHDAKNGYHNGVLGLYHNEERAGWLAYSEPIASVQLVFFVKKGTTIIWEKLEDLKPYKIGIEREYVYTDEFDSADYLEKEPVRKIELNLNKLLKDRVTLVAASRNVFLHMIKTTHPDKIHLIDIVSPPLTENKIYNGFTKTNPDHEQTVKDFNKGLQLIKQDGTFDSILKKHGFFGSE